MSFESLLIDVVTHRYVVWAQLLFLGGYAGAVLWALFAHAIATLMDEPA